MTAYWQQPVHPEELRPRRFWYWVAGLIAALGLVAGVITGVLVASSVVELSQSAEELDPRLQPLPIGTTTAVELEPGRDWAVYAASTAPASLSCGGTGLTVTEAPRDLSTVQDGTTWRQVQLVRVVRPGRHEITCTSTDRTVELALGRALDADAVARAGRRMAGAVFGIFGAIGLTSIGVLVGGLLALIVGLRRSSHRSALLAQRRQYPQPYPPYS